MSENEMKKGLEAAKQVLQQVTPWSLRTLVMAEMIVENLAALGVK